MEYLAGGSSDDRKNSKEVMVMNQERVPGWTWTLLVVASIIVGVATWWFSQSQAEKKLAKQPPEARAVIEVVIRPDHWMSVNLPYHHWFDFGFNEPFRVKLADGREFDFRPGQPKPFLGNEIPESRLYVKSLVGKEIKITVFLRPKT